MNLDDPIQVEATFDQLARLTPQSFVFEGTPHRVVQVGRRWDDGPWQHTLVMSTDGQTWDLAFSADIGAWRLKGRTPPGAGTRV